MNVRALKITLDEMREGRGGTRSLLAYCTDHRCGHHITLAPEAVDQWADDVRLSDLEPKFTCQKCGLRGADLRPEFAPAKMGTID